MSAVIDHFERLGIECRFDLVDSQVEERYIALQQQFHPDRFADRAPQERMAAMQQAMAVNEAYETLKSPLKRAEYLLKLQNIMVNTEGMGVKPDSQLLMEVMEHRQWLEEVETIEELAPLEQRITEDTECCIERLAQCFSNGNLDMAAQLTIRLQYLTKTAAEIRRVKKKL